MNRQKRWAILVIAALIVQAGLPAAWAFPFSISNVQEIEEATLSEVETQSFENPFEGAPFSEQGLELEGTLDVNAFGGAQYRIPLEVPIGTNGMTPQLSFQYSSLSENGIMGVGWSIGGMPTITRCKASVEYDGVGEKVDYQADDRFCFGGTPLRSTDDSYGEDGTEYRLEIDRNMRLISYGESGSGPTYFEADDSSGMRWTFGRADSDSTNPSILATGREEVRVWPLMEKRDLNGNTIRYEYEFDSETGEFQITTITYTGNEDENLSPYHSIEFVYEDRPDTTKRFITTTSWTQSKRLIEVQIHVEGTVAYTYELDYVQSDDTQRTLLNSLQRCDTEDQCTPPTQFEWSESSKDYTYTHTTTAPFDHEHFLVDPENNHLLDINGDRRSDFVDLNPSSGSSDPDSTLYFPNGQEFIQGDTLDLGPYDDGSWLTIENYWIRQPDNVAQTSDFNNDGWSDLLLIHPENGATWATIYHSTGTGFEKVGSQQIQGDHSNSNRDQKYYVGDFNGDDKTDVLDLRDFGDESCEVWLIEEDGASFTLHTIADIFDGEINGVDPLVERYLVMDTNDDGRDDIVYIDDHTGSGNFELKTYRSEGVQNGSLQFTELSETLDLEINTSELSSATVSFHATDVDGDQKRDVVGILNQGSSSLWIGAFLANGDGTFTLSADGYQNESLGRTDTTNFQTLFQDINGDAKADMLLLNRDVYDDDYFVEVWIGDGTEWSDSGYVTSLGGGEHESSEHWSRVWGDFNGDGLFDLFFPNEDDESVDIYTMTPQLHDHLVTIKQGDDTQFTLRYEPMNASTSDHYTMTADAMTEQNRFQDDRALVVEVKTDNGIGDFNTMEVFYENAEYDMNRGFMGFESITKQYDDLGRTVVTEYDNTFPFQGIPTQTNTYVEDPTTGQHDLNVEQQTWSYTATQRGNGIQAFQLDEIQSIRYELNGDQIMNQTQRFDDHDSYGNPGTTTIEDQTGYTQTRTVGYATFSDVWVIGKPQTVELSLEGPSFELPNQDASERYHKTTYSYDSEGRLTSESEFWSDDLDGTIDRSLTTNYEYDGFGNQTWKQTQGTSVTDAMEVSSTYDDTGRFVETQENALGHQIQMTYEPVSGQWASYTDENGLTSTFEHDSFGRLMKMKAPNERLTYYSYSEPADDAPDHTYQEQHTASSDGTTERFYLDRWGRTLRASVNGFDSQMIHVDQTYDKRGQLESETLPYFEGDASSSITYQYDSLGRMTERADPSGTTSWEHQGLASLEDNELYDANHEGQSVIEVNALGHTQQSLLGEHGELLQINHFDDAGTRLATQTYEYDAAQHLYRTADYAGNLTTTTANVKGLPLTLDDPDLGNMTFEYDDLGRLVAHEDAAGHQQTFEYDALGRLVERNTEEGQTTWTYDDASNGIGELAESEGPDSSTTLTYDTFGQLESQTLHVDNTSFTTEYDYDDEGRLTQMTYPNGFTLDYGYNDAGFLETLTDADAGTVYWNGIEMDALGQWTQGEMKDGEIQELREYDNSTMELIQQKISLNQGGSDEEGDGTSNLIESRSYQWDALGNWVDRSMAFDDVTVYESAEYDGLHRLTEWTHSRTDDGGDTVEVIHNQTYQYDEIGNLIYKSDVGDYHYGQGSAGPHAVTCIEELPENEGYYDDIDLSDFDEMDETEASFSRSSHGPTDARLALEGIPQAESSLTQVEATESSELILTPESSTESAGPTYDCEVPNIFYDQHFNDSGVGNVIKTPMYDMEWTSFGQPKTVTSDDGETQFTYDENDQKIQVTTYDSDGTELATTYRIGGHYDVTVDADGNEEQRSLIMVGDHPVAQHTQTLDSDGNALGEEVQYWITDHLGSITLVLDESNEVLERRHYKPFGETLLESEESLDTDDELSVGTTTDHNFAGHRQLRSGLIDMQARLYDPRIGRFVSADSIIPNMENTEAWNRYSYVYNNPLNQRDPDGHCPEFDCQPRVDYEDIVVNLKEFVVVGERPKTEKMTPKGFKVEYKEKIDEAKNPMLKRSVERVVEWDGPDDYIVEDEWVNNDLPQIENPHSNEFHDTVYFGGTPYVIPHYTREEYMQSTPTAKGLDPVFPELLFVPGPIQAINLGKFIPNSVKGTLLGKLLGYPNPVKRGAGGKWQPYSKLTGRFLSPASNPEIYKSATWKFFYGHSTYHGVKGFIEEPENPAAYWP